MPRHDHGKSYRCYYCGAPVPLAELVQVDRMLSAFDEDTRELVIDQLPPSRHRRAAPFVHETALGYPVLNICRKTLDGATERALHGEMS